MITTRYSPSPGPGLPDTLNITGIPLSAQIEQAYLWWSISGTDTSGYAIVTNPSFVTDTFSAVLIGSGVDKCWSAGGTRNFRADVTPSITGNSNGSYVIDISHGDTATDGATLLIIYIDSSAYYTGGSL